MSRVCDFKREFSIEEINKLLVGNVLPTGSHSYDVDVVSGNVDVLCELTVNLVSQLIHVSSYSNCFEESCKKIGEKARISLKEINDLIGVEVEDE